MVTPFRNHQEGTPIMDDMYSYPHDQHPSFSPPPDYTSPNPTDWTSATPSAPMTPPNWTPFGAQRFGDTAYAFLQSFVAWFHAIRPGLGEETRDSCEPPSRC
jgi:hypothetical protein